MEQLKEVELGEASQLGTTQDENSGIQSSVEINYSVVGDKEEDEVDLLVDVLFSVYRRVEEHHPAEYWGQKRLEYCCV